MYDNYGYCVVVVVGVGVVAVVAWSSQYLNKNNIQQMINRIIIYCLVVVVRLFARSSYCCFSY